MVGWVLATGLLATALTGAGLMLGAGSWLSGTPPWRVGVRLLVGLVGVAALSVCGGAAGGTAAYDLGWIGPKFWFDLEVPSGYEGFAALRFCPDEGEPLGDVVVLDDLGMATVRGSMPTRPDAWRFDVIRRDGTRTSATRNQVTSAGGCEWMMVAVGDSPGAYDGGSGDPSRYAAIAREDGIGYAEAARRLPYRLRVPDGYRGDLVVAHCPDAPEAGAEVVVDATGVARVGGVLPTSQPAAAPFPVRDASGAPLVGRMTRVEWGVGVCAFLEVRVAAQPPDATPVSSSGVEARYAEALARGVPYASVAPPP